MIQTVKINGNLGTGGLLRDVKTENQILIRETPPKGFVTSEEFRKRVKENIKQFYIDNGLL